MDNSPLLSPSTSSSNHHQNDFARLPTTEFKKEDNNHKTIHHLHDSSATQGSTNKRGVSPSSSRNHSRSSTPKSKSRNTIQNKNQDEDESEEEEIITDFPIDSGALYVLRTSDTVSAVSFGVPPGIAGKLMPCCLGKRELGVALLPCGFLHGRHLIVERVKVVSPAGDFLPLHPHGTYVSFQFELGEEHGRDRYGRPKRGCIRVEREPKSGALKLTSTEMEDVTLKWSSIKRDAYFREHKIEDEERDFNPYRIVDTFTAFRLHPARRVKEIEEDPYGVRMDDIGRKFIEHRRKKQKRMISEKNRKKKENNNDDDFVPSSSADFMASNKTQDQLLLIHHRQQSTLTQDQNSSDDENNNNKDSNSSSSRWHAHSSSNAGFSIVDFSTNSTAANTRHPSKSYFQQHQQRENEIFYNGSIESMKAIGTNNSSNREEEEDMDNVLFKNYDDEFLNDNDGGAEVEVEPVCAEGWRIRWNLHKPLRIEERVKGIDDPEYVFLLRKRSPHLITDFLIDYHSDDEDDFNVNNNNNNDDNDSDDHGARDSSSRKKSRRKSQQQQLYGNSGKKKKQDAGTNMKYIGDRYGATGNDQLVEEKETNCIERWVNKQFQDRRPCRVLQRSGREECSPLKPREIKAGGGGSAFIGAENNSNKNSKNEFVPSFPTKNCPIQHDFEVSLVAKYLNFFALLSQVIALTSTIFLAIGSGTTEGENIEDEFQLEPTGSIVLRYILYLFLIGSYVTLWLLHNLHHTSLLFDFLISRGYIMDITNDAIGFKYLFYKGWIWYFFFVLVYFGLGFTYFGIYRRGQIGSLWVFAANSLMFYFDLIKQFRSPFDQQLMPLTTFIRSFDSGLITETAIRRAANFMKRCQPTLACVALANPPAYVFHGISPHGLKCCWNCGKFAKRITILIIGSVLLGVIVFAATQLRLWLNVQNFDDMNVCMTRCIRTIPRNTALVNSSSDYNNTISNSSSTSTSTAIERQSEELCSNCFCLCARTLNRFQHGLSDICLHGMKGKIQSDFDEEGNDITGSENNKTDVAFSVICTPENTCLNGYEKCL